jgi:uncharacterized membrane protein YbaN (DUF454 family)
MARRLPVSHNLFVESSPARKPVHKSLRPIYLGLGCVFVGLGYVGYVVPAMPGTIFMILALWAFRKSSPKFEDWLLNQSLAGPILRDWEDGHSMRQRTKVVAIGVMWLSIAASCAIIWGRPAAVWLIPVLLACAVGVTVYIWTRPTKK